MAHTDSTSLRLRTGFPLREAVTIAVVAVVYYLSARLSLGLIIQPEGIAAVWPNSGIFLSAILLSRPRARPYLAVVLFLTDLIAEVQAGIPPAVSLVYSLCLTGDAVTSVFLLARFVGEPVTLRKTREVTGFLLLSVFLSNMFWSIGAALAAAEGLHTPFGTAWFWWATSDGVGNLLVTPLVLSLNGHIRTRFKEFSRRLQVEGAVSFVTVAILLYYFFIFAGAYHFPTLLLNLVTFPFLIWASMRFGVVGAATASALLAAVILGDTISGHFEFLGSMAKLTEVIIVQLYVSMLAIPSLLLAALTNERKQATDTLRESEERLRTVLEQAGDGFELIDEDGNYLSVNEASARQTGYTREEMEKLSVSDIDPLVDQKKYKDIFNSILGKPPLTFESQHRNKNGKAFPVEITTSIIPDKDHHLALSFVRDITERKQAEEQRARSMQEKETLLRELYHRTKNNMQVISSLLELQSSYIEDENLRNVLLDTQNRIRSMALVHQKLYEANDLSHVNLKEYIDDLIPLLVASHHVLPGRLSLQTDMENIFVSIDLAIPCGLILNELISNALKHAFPANRNGRIEISLMRSEDDLILLRIQDDGVGVPPGFDFKKDGRLGLQNVYALGQNQLNGKVEIKSNGNGVNACIQFKDNLYKPRV